MSRRRIRRSYGKKITLRNHKHRVRPMSGLTSVPVRFRGRRINYAK